MNDYFKIVTKELGFILFCFFYSKRAPHDLSQTLFLSNNSWLVFLIYFTGSATITNETTIKFIFLAVSIKVVENYPRYRLFQLLKWLNYCIIITMIDPCFDASDIESKNKSIYNSLKNNVNRAEIKQLIYYCSLVNKKGRIISFVSHMRLFLLLAWKDKPHTVGYIEVMRKLPPWNVLPDRKFQKQLKKIRSITHKDRVLEISFQDGEESWQLECETAIIAKKWQNLIQNHIKLQNNKQVQSKKVDNNIQKGDNSDMTLQICQRVQINVRTNSADQKYKQNEASHSKQKLYSAAQKITSFQNSSEVSSNYGQLSKKYAMVHEELGKEQQYKQKIERLKKQNSNLKAENAKLKNLNNQIREQSARLKIAKSVLSLLKEQYEKKHLQLTQLLNRKNFQIQKLLQKYADLALIKNDLEMNLRAFTKNSSKEMEKTREIFSSQFSSSSTDSTKIVMQIQPQINCNQENNNSLLSKNQGLRCKAGDVLIACKSNIY